MDPAGKKADEPPPSGQSDLQPAVPIIFSIGYEGKTLEAFIALLKGAGVERLIDVRDAPYSRKIGFSKAPLEQALKAASIEYIGIPELGTAKAVRDKFKSDSNVEDFLLAYKAGLEHNREHYERLKALARERPSAIMCYEQDYRECHRQILEERLAKDGFRVLHLGEDGQESLEEFQDR
jgi:uncharacterized protein (DUF488 family)